MKNLFFVALLSTAFGTSAVADDSATKVPALKSTLSAPSDHKTGHIMATKKGACDSKHEMEDYHRHGHGMMGDLENDMLLEPDLFLLRVLTLSKEQNSQIQNFQMS